MEDEKDQDKAESLYDHNRGKRKKRLIGSFILAI